MYRLRELEKMDMPIINKWRNEPELMQYLVAPFRYINTSVDEAWFDHYIATRDHNVRCAIIQETNEEVIGCVYLLNIDWICRNADMGIMIGERANRGNGAGNFAVKSILDLAFLDMGLHRVQLVALESNERAIKLYEKFGFQKEGILRECVLKRGHFVNLISMAVLREEYLGITGCE